MDNDIIAAADALALQRIQAQDYRNATAQSAESVAAFRVATLAAQKAQLDAFNAAAAPLLTNAQEVYLRLYDMHLRIRLGPSVISTTTAQSVINDIVTDAAQMTALAWPTIKSQLDAL